MDIGMVSALSITPKSPSAMMDRASVLTNARWMLFALTSSGCPYGESRLCKINAVVLILLSWPITSQVDLDDNLRIWRNFKLGKLLDLVILDTRNYDRSITDLGMWIFWYCPYKRLIVLDRLERRLHSPHQRWCIAVFDGFSPGELVLQSAIWLGRPRRYLANHRESNCLCSDYWILRRQWW